MVQFAAALFIFIVLAPIVFSLLAGAAGGAMGAIADNAQQAAKEAKAQVDAQTAAVAKPFDPEAM